MTAVCTGSHRHQGISIFLVMQGEHDTIYAEFFRILNTIAISITPHIVSNFTTDKFRSKLHITKTISLSLNVLIYKQVGTLLSSGFCIIELNTLRVYPIIFIVSITTHIKRIKNRINYRITSSQEGISTS